MGLQVQREWGVAPSLGCVRTGWGGKEGGEPVVGGRRQASGLQEKVALTQSAQLTLQVKNNQGKGLVVQGGVGVG